MSHLAPVAVALALVAAPAVAQGAASSDHVVVPVAFADGGTSQSATYALEGAFGPAPSAAVAFSSGYALAVGFAAALDVPIGPTPHLTGTAPPYATMRSGASLTVHGTGLIWGTSPQLTIGGVPAAIGSRTNAELTTALPIQPAPGWQPVTFTSGGATTTLARGVGVLPLLDMEPAIGIGVPSELVYRGRQGDIALWCLANGTIPPVPLLGLGYGLALEPTTLVVGALDFVADPSGEVRLPIPALISASTLYLQVASLSNDPGYSPGSFTNALRVF